MLLELTSMDDLPVFVSPFMIESITQLPGSTMIGTASGDQIMVKEDASDVNIDLANLVAQLSGATDTGSMH